MPVHEYRELKPTAEAEAIYRRWLARLNDEFTRHTKPEIRSQIVRDELVQLEAGDDGRHLDELSAPNGDRRDARCATTDAQKRERPIGR